MDPHLQTQVWAIARDPTHSSLKFLLSSCIRFLLSKSLLFSQVKEKSCVSAGGNRDDWRLEKW